MNKLSELESQLESLNVKIQESQNQLEVTKLEFSTRTRQAAELKKRIKKIKEPKIKRKNPEAIFVSDHALVRYMERVLGADIEELKAKILPGETLKLMKELSFNDGRYPCGDFYLVLKDGVVVTIID